VIGERARLRRFGLPGSVANQQLGTQVGFIQPAIYAPRPPRPSTTSPRATTAPSRPRQVGRMLRLGSPIAGKLIPLLAPAAGAPKPP